MNTKVGLCLYVLYLVTELYKNTCLAILVMKALLHEIRIFFYRSVYSVHVCDNLKI